MGATGVFSMPATTKPWLCKLLVTSCGIDEGRSAWMPQSGVIVSAYQVLTERTTLHVIKTIASGFSVTDNRDESDLESTVVRIRDRRENDNGEFEYQCEMEGGSFEWLGSRAFFSDDGTMTESFLDYIDKQQLERALELYSLPTLQQFCMGQNLKATGNVKARVIKRLVKSYIRLKVCPYLMSPNLIPEECWFCSKSGDESSR